MEGGDPDGAERLLRDALRWRRAQQRTQPWTVPSTMSLLGLALLRQERWEEAEPLLVEAAERLESIEAPTGLRRAALERAIELYETWDRAEEAAAWSARLAEISDPPAG